MTTEIIVANRGAIALAADSAASVRSQEGVKIYSANKIFPLSKVAPVGVMIYGVTSFCGIPWETIIKEFRSRHLKGDVYRHLVDYKQSFISFLEKFAEGKKSLLDVSRVGSVEHFLDRLIGEILSPILHGESVDFKDVCPGRFLELILDRKKSLPQDEEAYIPIEIDEAVTSDVERALSLVFEGAGEERRQRLLGESGSPEEKEIFENLVEFALASCRRKDLDLPELGTGLVFAGFGEDEIFPSYSELKINGLLGSQVWRFERRSDCIGSDSCVSICPFAQSDVIETFMNGISCEHEDFLLNGVMPRILESLDKDLSQEVLEEAKRTFGRALKTFSWENFSRPVVDSTSFLHFDELATMAETLVNLTSFKRRVSPFAETVGGPVDVAVITKGDGFVWIKRKHYFPSEINYRFFKNYLREVEFLSEQGGDENVFNGQEGREDLFSQAGF